MKLVVATPLYPPEIGGPATYVRELEEGLPSRGIELKIVKFSEVRHLPKLVRHYAYYRRILAALRDADAVLALDPVSVGLPAHFAAKRLGKPLVVKIVGDYAWEQGRQRFGVTQELDEFVRTPQTSSLVRTLQKIEKLVASEAKAVIVPSHYLQHIVTSWGVPEENVRVIYNSVTIEGRGKVPNAVLAAQRPLVLTAGRLVPWKGIDGVIEAMASVPNATLIISGHGPERESLQRRAEEKIPGRYIFTETLSHPDMLATLEHADVFVLYSSYEGLSHILVEALMLGTPAIAARVGGNPEVLEEQNLVTRGNTAELAERIKNVLNNDQKQKMPAFEKITDKQFLPGTMLMETINLLRQL